MAILTDEGIEFSVGDELNSRRQIFPLGTVWSFFQASAPTGWTKITTHDNKALRVVSGTGGGSGGTTNFTTVFSPTRVIGGTVTVTTPGVQPHTLTTAQIPAHAHTNGGEIGLSANPQNPDGSFTGGDVRRGGGFFATWARNSPGTGNQPAPNGGAHTHPFTGSGTLSDQNLSVGVQYIDIIVCSFDG